MTVLPPPSGYKTWESEVICKKLREVTCWKNVTVTFVVTAERPEFAVYHLVINNESSFESLRIVFRHLSSYIKVQEYLRE